MKYTKEQIAIIRKKEYLKQEALKQLNEVKLINGYYIYQSKINFVDLPL